MNYINTYKGKLKCDIFISNFEMSTLLLTQKSMNINIILFFRNI